MSVYIKKNEVTIPRLKYETDVFLETKCLYIDTHMQRTIHYNLRLLLAVQRHIINKLDTKLITRKKLSLIGTRTEISQ